MEDANVKLSDFVIVVILFSMGTTAFAVYIGGVENAYEEQISQNLQWQPSNESFNETFSNMAGMQQQSEQMANQTRSQGLTGSEYADTLAGGTWNVIGMVWNSFGLLKDLVGDVAKALGLPIWVVTGALAILTVFLVFTIIGLFTRRDPV